MSKKTHEFEVLRVGKFTDANGQDVEITQANLQELADGYDAENAPSPFVLGHPKDNEPAFGWAEAFKVVGDKLIAMTSNLHASLHEAISQNKFKKVSLSIFNPTSPANPKSGKMYVRHIGLLGAVAPAVSGLKPISLSNEDDCMTIDTTINKTNLVEKLREFLSFSHAEIKTEEKVMTDTRDEQIAKLTADLSEYENKVVELQRLQNEIKAKAVQSDFVSFCDNLVNAGKLAPAVKEAWVNLAGDIQMSDIELSEGKATVIEKMKALMTKQAEILDFTEKSKSTKQPQIVNFNAPRGYQVDNNDLNKLAEAQAYAQANSVSLAEAAKAIGA